MAHRFSLVPELLSLHMISALHSILGKAIIAVGRHLLAHQALSNTSSTDISDPPNVNSDDSLSLPDALSSPYREPESTFSWLLPLLGDVEVKATYLGPGVWLVATEDEDGTISVRLCYGAIFVRPNVLLGFRFGSWQTRPSIRTWAAPQVDLKQSLSERRTITSS